ncbi:hypothetical protein [Alsobacter sp. SYSU BS001988]
MRYFLAIAGMIAGMSAPVSAQQRPVSQAPNTIQELFAFLGQCVSLPAGSEGSEITLRFSLNHIGVLRGKPLVAYSKLTGDQDTQRKFIAAALAALDKCTPVPMTEHFGKVAGQKMILWRIISPERRA